MLSEIEKLISDDGYAASFQTMGQYRAALLAALRAQADAGPSYYVNDDNGEVISASDFYDTPESEWTALYTRPAPEAAQALSDEDRCLIQEASTYIAWMSPWGHKSKYVIGLRALLTRNAATVAEPIGIEELEAAQQQAERDVTDHSDDVLEMVEQQPGTAECQHKRYTYDTSNQEGHCFDCGAEGRMQFVVSSAPHPSGLAEQAEPVVDGNFKSWWLSLPDDVKRGYAEHGVLAAEAAFAAAQPGQRAGVADVEAWESRAKLIDALSCILIDLGSIGANVEPGSVPQPSADRKVIRSAWLTARDAIAAAPTQPALEQDGQRAGVAEDAARYQRIRELWFECGMHNINTPLGAALNALANVADRESLDAVLDSINTAAPTQQKDGE